jgi:hypothetical protein
MESVEAKQVGLDRIRGRNIRELTALIVFRRDAELAYYEMTVLNDSLDLLSKARLVNTIVGDRDRGIDFAFKMLRAESALDEELRDELLQAIVNSRDKTVCNQTLLLISSLGRWEEQLRQVIES